MRTVPTGPSDHYIRLYLAHLAREEAPEATVSTYRSALRVLDSDLPRGIARSSAEEITAAIKAPHRHQQTGRLQHRGPATRKLYRAAVVSFFAFACDDREDEPLLDFDPAPWLASFRRPRGRARTIPTDELQDILERAHDPYRVWYLLAAGAGLRAVEISRLDREDIDSTSMLIHGKGDVDRTVFTHADVWAAVRTLPRGPIARDRHGERATRRQVYGRGNNHLQTTLGYPHWSMHDFRRWFATNAHHLAGGDLAVTQDLLGHVSPDTTRVYVDVLAEKKRAAVAGLPLRAA